MISVMHLIPEDGEVEMWSMFPKRATFRRGGAVEVSRELLGTTTFREGEWSRQILDDFAKRARKQLSSIRDAGVNDGQEPGAAIPVTCLVEEVLRPVGLKFLSDRKEQVPAQGEKVPRSEFSVSVIHVSRSRAGPIWTDALLRSIAS